MSAATQGTPAWLVRLEQAQVQLRDEGLIHWLKNIAPEHGVPQDVIEAQLLRLGVPAAPVAEQQQKVETVAEPVVPTAKPVLNATKTRTNKKG